MALVPFRVLGAAADQDMEQRMLQFGGEGSLMTVHHMVSDSHFCCAAMHSTAWPQLRPGIFKKLSKMTK